jgi:hypothetical protein
VHEILLSNGDTFLLTAPLVFLSLFAVLRLDGRLGMPARPYARRPIHQLDSQGEIILTDPDGRPSFPVPPPETEDAGTRRVNERKIETVYCLDNKTGYL